MKKYKNLIRFFKIILGNKKLITCAIFIVMLVGSLLGLMLPQITKNIIDNAITYKNLTLLYFLVLAYFLFNLIKVCMDFILSYLNSIIKKSISAKIKIFLLNHLSKLSGSYFSNIKTGNLLSIVERDIFIVESFSSEDLFSIIIDIISALTALYFLVTIQLDLFIIVIILQITLGISQTLFTKKISSKTYEVRNNYGDISNIMQEYISNIMNIVMTNSKFKFFSKYISKEKVLLKKCMSLDITIASNRSISQIISNFITISIYGYGGFKIISGKMSIGDLIAFQQYTSMLIGPCMNIIRANTRIQQALISINRIFSVLDEPIIIKQENQGERFDENFESIVLKNVSFSYLDTKVLSNINIEFKKGEITSLVGSSGCGKSTIVNLLFRLWDVDEGEILINNIELRKYNLKSLRQNISVVTQDLLLFDDTIFNNLTLNNKVDKQFVEDICKRVGVYKFINELHDGFNTIVGEKGVRLSGGQKQRIAIARALINQSSILIFDEATSALDNISQKNIFDNIKDLLNTKTVILIAHRLSTVKGSDKIYVIDKGNIVEEGSHHELLSNKCYYYNLINNVYEEEALA